MNDNEELDSWSVIINGEHGQLGLGFDHGKVLGEVLHRMLLVVKLIVHKRVVVATDASKETRFPSHGGSSSSLVDTLWLVASHCSVPFSCFEHLLLPGR